MTQMRTVVVDKIASIAQAGGLGHELRIATADNILGWTAGG